MALKLASKLLDFLQKHPDQLFEARQIALWIIETYPALCAEKRAQSNRLESDTALLQQLVAEIGARCRELRRKYPQLVATEERPRRYGWSGTALSVEVKKSDRTRSET